MISICLVSFPLLSPSPQRFPSFFPTVCQTARLLSCSLTALWSHFPTVAALSPATPVSPLPLPSYRLKSMKLHRPFLSPLTLWILFGLVLWILLPSRCALASLCLPLWMLSGLVSPAVWLSARRVGLFLQNFLCPRLAGLFKMSDESVRAVIYFLFFSFPLCLFINAQCQPVSRETHKCRGQSARCTKTHTLLNTLI